jgi:hypothetical protein
VCWVFGYRYRDKVVGVFVRFRAPPVHSQQDLIRDTIKRRRLYIMMD